MEYIQVSGDTEVTSAFENSLVSAYRAILADISRELSDLGQELVTSDDDTHEERLVRAGLQTRLGHMSSRCYQLQYNLHQTRGQCANNIAGNNAVVVVITLWGTDVRSEMLGKGNVTSIFDCTEIEDNQESTKMMC